MLRTGEPAYHDVFSRPFWEDLHTHPALAARFDALMGPTGHGTPDWEILVIGEWGRVQTIVDVGGGTGPLLVEPLRAPVRPPDSIGSYYLKLAMSGSAPIR